ncbi:cytochrome c oxidase subunit II [Brevibacillus daliensis]|uniref:cytochrome c oxidase subunit II n=1 Tax=Brevibacillus daliensis TaxID=2892995 RepID=UPI001E5469F7|nr:cytochrome c oxidase subunit II [Brevibacillus daliensis]
MIRRLQHVGRMLPLLLMVALLLTGCGDPYLSALQPKGSVADMQFNLIKLSIIIMLGVFTVVVVIFTYVLIRYRKKKGDNSIPEQVEGNHKLEIIWTAIPFVLLIILAVPMVTTTFALAKDYSNDKNVVQITVTGHQFWWEFEYPDQKIKTAQELYIPVNKKAHIKLESADVIHSFWVPALGGKKDTNPGMTNYLWLDAKEEGVFQGRCAELCGESHALMDFKVKVVSQEEYDQWVAKMTKGTNKPANNAVLADQGAEIFQKSCVNCHAVDGKGGPAGPDLTNFGDRTTVAGILKNDKKQLAKWLTDPEAVKPGNLMIIPKLEEKQVDALVEYLHSLKRE